MKLLKRQDGSPLPYAVFSADDTDNIGRFLSGDDPGEVLLFTAHCQFLCNRVLQYRETIEGLRYRRPSVTDHRMRSENAITQIRETAKILKKIVALDLPPHVRYTLADLGPMKANEPDPFAEKNREAVQAAEKALSELGKIEQAFTDGLPPAKHGNAQINQEFAEQVVDAYRRFIGEPTAGVNDAFPCILQIIFKAVGIDLKYPERLTRKILKKNPTE